MSYENRCVFFFTKLIFFTKLKHVVVHKVPNVVKLFKAFKVLKYFQNISTTFKMIKPLKPNFCTPDCFSKVLIYNQFYRIRKFKHTKARMKQINNINKINACVLFSLPKKYLPLIFGDSAMHSKPTKSVKDI